MTSVSETTILKEGDAFLGETLGIDVPFGSTAEQQPGRGIDWVPLVIVIGAVYLISISLVYGSGSYFGGDDFRVEYTITLILGFFAATLFILAIASVVFRRVDRARRLLMFGMLLVIVVLVIRTEVYLRGIWS